MKSNFSKMQSVRQRTCRPPWTERRGNILVLSAAGMVMIFAFLAFTVDVGFIAVTKTQMQGASDGAVLASGLELFHGWGPGAESTGEELTNSSRAAASLIASLNPSGDRDGCYVDEFRDVRFGHRQWNATTGSYDELWGVTPFNMVEVTIHRDQLGGGGNGAELSDAPVPLFFGPVIGHEQFELATVAVAAFQAGVGFRISAGSDRRAELLPIALDQDTWDTLMAGVGEDKYAYHPDTGQVSHGQDGILEVNLYPEGTTDLPPGNRGTVDLGSPNNSTDDLKRQILYGLNEYDLSFFNGELRTDQGPLYLNGDTGLSAGIKEELQSIIGKPRAIPLFTAVSSPGNNATYTVEKFVGVRVLDVKLTGAPSTKHVTIQPCPFTDNTVIPGDVRIEPDSIIAPITIVR